jgi:hypothetical protein
MPILNDIVRSCFFFRIDLFYVKYLDNDRLESLEREMASLKGQVTQSFVAPTNEQDLNRSFTTKKSSIPPPTSARVLSPSRVPLPFNPRKLLAD